MGSIQSGAAPLEKMGRVGQGCIFANTGMVLGRVSRAGLAGITGSANSPVGKCEMIIQVQGPAEETSQAQKVLPAVELREGLGTRVFA